MSNGKPTIITSVHFNTGSTGPFSLPAPSAATWPDGSTHTSVLLELTGTMEAGKYVYNTVTYLVGPGAANTSVTLTKPTTWYVLVDLPDGIATPLTAIADAVFPAATGAQPDDGNPPPPVPGTVHGGNQQ